MCEHAGVNQILFLEILVEIASNDLLCVMLRWMQLAHGAFNLHSGATSLIFGEGHACDFGWRIFKMKSLSKVKIQLTT